MDTKNADKFLNGQLLYGNDFNTDEIEEWYNDEKEGYANLINRSTYKYGYHAWNKYHGFNYLKNRKFPHAMGFGSAYGDEFLPIISNINKITIIDSSDHFKTKNISGVSTQYVKPVPNGEIPLDNNQFDLITCFGVLHHIPNVSFVINEITRVLKSQGILLLREPIISMGDWRQHRTGLTKRERGIPINILEKIIKDSGLTIIKKSFCGFPVLPKLSSFFLKNEGFSEVDQMGAYNSDTITRIDSLLSTGFAWNINYHPRNFLQKIRPTSVFFILEKL